MTSRALANRRHPRFRWARKCAWLYVAWLSCACSSTSNRNPDPERIAPLTEPRVLAVIAEPAEVRPGETASLTAVLAKPSNDATESVEAWDYCTEPRVPGSATSAPASCLTDATIPLGARVSAVMAMLPTDACRNFGPDPPQGDFRPQDPDVTGGYYQPIRFYAFERYWFHFQRLRCSLGNAPTEVARTYFTDYVANQNPAPSSVEIRTSETLTSVLDAGTTSSTADVTASFAEVSWQVPQETRSVSLHLTWQTDPRETYLRFDPDAHALVEQREDVSITWHINSGILTPGLPTFSKHDSSVSAQLESFGDQTSVWAVVRDSRGGSAALHLDIEH